MIFLTILIGFILLIIFVLITVGIAVLFIGDGAFEGIGMAALGFLAGIIFSIPSFYLAYKLSKKIKK